MNLASSPEIYVNEWASFSTRDFPENRAARCGDKVLIVMLDVEDRRHRAALARGLRETVF